MALEIASVLNRALFHQQASAHIRIMKAKCNANGANPAVTHMNKTTEIAVQDRDTIITAARTVDKGLVDVKENKSCKRLTIDAVSLMWYIGKGPEGLQKLPEESDAEN
jgi:hypothetical protein